MKANLPNVQPWQGNYYGPGLVEVPESLAIALGIREPAKTATVAV